MILMVHASWLLEERFWVTFLLCVSPGPETLMKTTENRVYERTIRMVNEEGIETIDVDGSGDGEKVRKRGEG
jgi:hypothetical protein